MARVDSPRVRVDSHLDADAPRSLAEDVLDGLTRPAKELAPKYFYDEHGSQLFEAITELEEYYPTRRERQILVERSAEIIAAAGNPATLIELGSGSASKTRHLLDAMRDGVLDGMQCFDDELEKLVRAGTVTMATALLHATNPGNLQVQMADVPADDLVITR